MKLKELPISIFHCLRLRYLSQSNNFNSPSIPVIISLTSIPSRLGTLDIVISSLLEQTKQAKLIVLWLNSSLKKTIPERLWRLQSKKFIICYCEGNSSYRKLLPSLKAYPNDIIVTCDDDIIYPKDWLKKLYEPHKTYPNFVITHAARSITRNSKDQLKPYKNWTYINSPSKYKNILPIGFSGVLYPPETFALMVFDEKIFMELCPKADDLWFKAMAHLNTKKTYCTAENLNFIPIFNSQKEALGKTNIKQDMNASQWTALCDYYPKLKELG